MNKLYNNKNKISTNLKNYLEKVLPNFSRPNINNTTNTVLSVTLSPSIVLDDLALYLQDSFAPTKFDSKVKRLFRFLSSNTFNGNNAFKQIITDVIQRFNPKHNNIYISFDHSYCKDKFTTLMFSLRLGKQGIPLYFESFHYLDAGEAFSMEFIKSGIKYCYDLFKHLNAKIHFLADRWFNFVDIMEYIDSLGCYYYIRTKTNLKLDIPSHPYNDCIDKISDIEATYSKSIFFEEVYITESKYKCKLTVSKSKDHEEPYFILTNGDTKKAVKIYGYRFGSIETIFKNSKSNGFNLEKNTIKNLTTFRNLYAIVCIAYLWLSIIGADYSKNRSKFNPLVQFRIMKYQSKNKKNNCRDVSLFKCGLRLLRLIISSNINTTVKCNFKLYDC